MTQSKELKQVRDALESIPVRPDIRHDDICDEYFVWALINYDAIKFALENVK